LKGVWIDSEQAKYEGFKGIMGKLPPFTPEALPKLREMMASSMGPDETD
jgi:hypothetical protein